MDLTTQTETFTGEKRRWLIGGFGTDRLQSVALNPDLFPTSDPRFADDVVPSGTMVGFRTDSVNAIECGAWDHAATNGLQYAVGVVFSTTKIARGQNGSGGFPISSTGSGVNQTSVAVQRIGDVEWYKLLELNPGLADSPEPLWKGPGVMYVYLPNNGWPDFVGFAFNVQITRP